MNQYVTTSQEEALLLLPHKTQQLRLLEKKTISRIQIVSFKGVKALKSIDDIYKKIRIVLISLLIKIFITYNSANQERLDRLKKIVYNAKLEAITEQKGIEREHLLKSVAKQFYELKIGNNVEMEIIKLFNCSPFFDQTIISAIKQENPLVIDSDCQLSVWLDRELSIKVLWNQEALIEQTQEELCLIGLGQQFHASKDCKSSQCFYKGFKQYLRFSTIAFDNQEDSLRQIHDRMTREQLFSCPMSQDKISTDMNSSLMHPSLYVSIESVSPGYRTPFDKGKQNRERYVNSPQTINVGLFDSVNSLSFSKSRNKNEQKNTTDKIIKVRRSSKNQGSSIWNILCCSLDSH